MSRVRCEQLRYTWAERRLDGSGPGFGVVLRSAGWPAALLDDPDLRELVTGLPIGARRLDAEFPTSFLSHRRWEGGAVLVAKRPVGTDGAGRPGNYAVHALFDPGATLGALDLEPLLTAGYFSLERRVDGEPDADAPALQVPAAARWSLPPARGARPVSTATSSEPVTHWDADELRELLAERCLRVPADLVNALEVEGAREPGAAVAVDPAEPRLDAVPEVFAAAAELGARDEPFWWRRRGADRATWTDELEAYWVEHVPVHRLPDDQLWRRWDATDLPGRNAVAGELLERGALVEDAVAAEEVARRPALVDDLTEAGVRGGTARTATAARWVAAVGSDDQVVDLVAELVSTAGGPALPPELLGRLGERSPDEMPTVLVDAVVPLLPPEAFAGSAAPATRWRAAALHRALDGRLALPGPDGLAAAAGDDELVAGLRAALADGAGVEDCWDRLGELVPPGRRATAFAAASGPTAQHLLTRGVSPGPRSVAALSALWPTVARTAGWSPAVRDVFGEVRRRERTLRRQRALLIVAAGVLLAAVVVLALLLGDQPRR